MGLMDGGGEGIIGGSPDRDGCEVNSYECQPAVERLEKYIADHKVNNKRAVAQAVVDTLRIVSRDSPHDVATVLQIFSRLADDSDAPMRTDVMVQVPQIALLCYEVAEQLAGVVEGHLLPLVIKTLTDIEESVRKTAQTALIMLIEQNLVTREAIEDQVCPVVLMLAEMGTLPDYHPSAVTLMSKIAPLVGREKAMELFLDHFVVLCSDPDMFVRTVCASNIGDFCTLMGTEVTEHVLLPCFVQLCKDSVWGVRKECANVFLSVSCVVSLATRKQVLAPIFVEILRDQSRWVKIPAFHSLGPFIWTLAPDSIRSPEPHSPAIEPNTPRTSHPQNKFSRLRNICFGVDACEDLLAKHLIDPVAIAKCDPYNPYWPDFTENEESEEPFYESSTSFDRDENLSREESSREELKVVPEPKKAELPEPENDFNTFLFWRIPLPDVGPNLSIGDVAEPKNSCSSVVTTNAGCTPVTSSLSTGDQHVSSPSVEDSPTVAREKMEVSWCTPRVNDSSDCNEPTNQNEDQPVNTFEEKDNGSSEKPSAEVLSDDEDEDGVIFTGGHVKIDVLRHKQGTYLSACSTQRCTSDGWDQSRKLPAVPRTSLVQDIVPQALVDHYVSMSTPLPFIDDETELTHHCAFNFPAVALTLGRENWPLLSGAYEVLAVNVQWKVRHTLASSIHELAVILGEELAARYLVPIFVGFVKDLDEVRIGVVKHLADFLKLVGPAGRNECLPCLFNLLTTGNVRKWRFRDELTRQLMQVTYLFSPKDVRKYLTHIGIALVFSPVATLRQNALLLLAEHIRYLSVEKILLKSLLVKLAKEFAQSGHWVRRQSYAFLCEQLFVPRSRRESRSMRDFDDDDEEEGADTGQFTNRDLMLDEWVDEGQDNMAWRTRIAPLLAQHVFPHLLDLSSDKVPNVRIAVARVLGSFQATPTEQSYLQSYIMDETGESDGGDIKRVPALELALERLQKDMDRDVRYFASRHQLSCSSETSGLKLSCPTIEDTIG